jgi:flagellar protein FlaG
MPDPKSNQPQPDSTRITLTKTADYRDAYANSVQVRLSIWDFFLVFGTLEQHTPEEMKVENFQGIYLSPQQAKALLNVLTHNIAQYEQTFGPISLDGNAAHHFTVPTNGPVH